MESQTASNKALVLRYWEEVWNEGKLALIEEFLAPEVGNPDGVRAFISGWREAFPGSRVVLDAVVAEGDLVVTRYHCRGNVHTNTWEASLQGLSMAVPPTSKEIPDHGIAIFQVTDGKIVKTWAEWNQLEVAQQLVPLSG